MKKLKLGKDKKVFGVCSGLAEYFDADPTVVRLGFCCLMFLSCGYSTLFYIIAGIVMPDNN